MLPQTIGLAQGWPRPAAWGLWALALALVVPALAVGRSPDHGAGGAGSRVCPDSSIVASPRDLSRVNRSVVCLINQQRRWRGVGALARSRQLDLSASFHCADMLSHHYFAHNHPGRPSLLERIRWTGYFDHAAHGLYAENLGEGPEARTTPEGLVDAWMRSPEHRATILDPRLLDIGIGAALAPPDPAFYARYSAVVVTTDFGAREVNG